MLLSPLSPQQLYLISIEKNKNTKNNSTGWDPESKMKRKPAVKIWNRKSVASVQAGDKSTALHTQTQGFCGWVTPSSPGALTVAVLSPWLAPDHSRHPALHTADPGAWYTLSDSRGFKGICASPEDWWALRIGNHGKQLRGLLSIPRCLSHVITAQLQSQELSIKPSYFFCFLLCPTERSIIQNEY